MKKSPKKSARPSVTEKSVSSWIEAIGAEGLSNRRIKGAWSTIDPVLAGLIEAKAHTCGGPRAVLRDVSAAFGTREEPADYFRRNDVMRASVVCDWAARMVVPAVVDAALGVREAPRVRLYVDNLRDLESPLIWFRSIVAAQDNLLRLSWALQHELKMSSASDRAVMHFALSYVDTVLKLTAYTGAAHLHRFHTPDGDCARWVASGLAGVVWLVPNPIVPSWGEAIDEVMAIVSKAMAGDTLELIASRCRWSVSPAKTTKAAKKSRKVAA